MARILGIGFALNQIVIRNVPSLADFGLAPQTSTLVGIEAFNDALALAAHLGLERIDFAGGSAANTLRGLAGLGVGTGLIGKVGGDAEGEALYNSLRAAGISPSLISSVARTGQSLTLIDTHLQRSTITFLGAAATLNAVDLDAREYTGFDLLLLEGNTVRNHKLMNRAIHIARDAQLKVVLDLGNYAIIDANREFLHREIPGRVDVLLANEVEARAFTGQNPTNALRELAAACPIVAIKLGEEGAMAQRGDEFAHVPIRRIAQADTTGGGDLFAAGFLYGLCHEATLEASLRLGNHLASEVLQCFGAHIPSEKWPELLHIAEDTVGSCAVR